MSDTTRYLCPLDCGWHHDVPPIGEGEVPYDPPGEWNLDDHLRRLLTVRAARAEKVIREHCESHTVEEWATALMETRGERDALAVELADVRRKAQAVRDWMATVDKLGTPR